MNENFPIDKEKMLEVRLGLRNHGAANLFVKDGDHSRSFNICGKELVTNEIDWVEHEQHYRKHDCEFGTAVEQVFDYFFTEIKGEIDYFRCEVLYANDAGEEDPEALEKVKKCIAGRPISTVFLSLEAESWKPNNPLPSFIREYVDYKMFGAFNRRSKEKLEVTEKMMNCEYLCFQCGLVNPEKLKEFKGWGLVLEKAEENGFDFEFFFQAVQDWYNGEASQWRYLGLGCAPDEKWDQLTSLGKPIRHKHTGKEYELKRSDGQTCTIGHIVRLPNGVPTPAVYFFLGPKTDVLEWFNADWDRL